MPTLFLLVLFFDDPNNKNQATWLRKEIVFTKTFKLLNNPTVEELGQQLQIVSEHIVGLVIKTNFAHNLLDSFFVSIASCNNSS